MQTNAEIVNFERSSQLRQQFKLWAGKLEWQSYYDGRPSYSEKGVDQALCLVRKHIRDSGSVFFNRWVLVASEQMVLRRAVPSSLPSAESSLLFEVLMQLYQFLIPDLIFSPRILITRAIEINHVILIEHWLIATSV